MKFGRDIGPFIDKNIKILYNFSLLSYNNKRLVLKEINPHFYIHILKIINLNLPVWGKKIFDIWTFTLWSIKKSFDKLIKSLVRCFWTSEVTCLAVLAPAWIVVLWLKWVCLSVGAHATLEWLWLGSWDFVLLFADKVVVGWLSSHNIFSLKRVVGSQGFVCKLCWCLASLNYAIFLSSDVVYRLNRVRLSFFNNQMLSFIDVLSEEWVEWGIRLVPHKALWSRLDCSSEFLLNVDRFSSSF